MIHNKSTSQQSISEWLTVLQFESILLQCHASVHRSKQIHINMKIEFFFAKLKYPANTNVQRPSSTIIYSEITAPGKFFDLFCAFSILSFSSVRNDLEKSWGQKTGRRSYCPRTKKNQLSTIQVKVYVFCIRGWGINRTKIHTRKSLQVPGQLYPY